MKLFSDFYRSIQLYFWYLLLDELEMTLHNKNVNYCDYLEAKMYIKNKITKLK